MTATPHPNTTLSRLRLNPRHPEVDGDLRDAQRMHRRVMSLLPDALGGHARANAGVLYRVEQHTTGPVVILQAQYATNPAALPAGYAEVSTHRLGTMLANITHGLEVRYRILANPTHIETVDGRKVRRWIRGEDALEWWRRRAHQAGIAPDTALLTHEKIITVERGSTRIPHGTSLFDGTATITDAETARQAVLTGIGRARSYGCGLLSLAPART